MLGHTRYYNTVEAAGDIAQDYSTTLSYTDGMEVFWRYLEVNTTTPLLHRHILHFQMKTLIS